MQPDQPVDAEAQTLLKQVLENQAKQAIAIEDIHSKVGCLFLYMILSIVIGVIAFIVNLAS